MIFTVHEYKRPARNSAELMTLAADLEAAIQLELLTRPLIGIYDPRGAGSMLFAVLANSARLDRNYIREKTLEDQAAAAAKSHHGGRPKDTDDDMLTFAQALRDQGTPMPEIGRKPTVKTGENTGAAPVGGLALPRALRPGGDSTTVYGRPAPAQLSSHVLGYSGGTLSTVAAE